MFSQSTLSTYNTKKFDKMKCLAGTSFGGGGKGGIWPPWYWKIVIICVSAHNIFFSSYFAPSPP